MEVHNVLQGTDEWLDLRFTKFGASDAAAMLGLSKRMTREELLHSKKTGIQKKHSQYTIDVLFANGHKAEEMARPIMEEIIGDDLYPVTCSEGKILSSCDGLTYDRKTAWEHKQWNKVLVKHLENNESIPEHLMPQCQQVLMVTGASELYFSVGDGSKEKNIFITIKPDPEWFKKIKAGWKQFEKDLAKYTPPVLVAEAVAAPIEELPALSYVMEGTSLTSNVLTEYKPAVLALIKQSEAKPESDQDFADLDASNKNFRAATKRCDVILANALAEIADVDKFTRDLKEIQELMRQAALKGEKVYKTENENRKNAIRQKGVERYELHMKVLQDEFKKLVGSNGMIAQKPDFVLAGKGLSSLSSLENAIDTCLANAIIKADEVMDDIKSKVEWFNLQAKDHLLIFNDLNTIIYKDRDDFELLVKTRIKEHQEAIEAAAQKKIEDEKATQEKKPEPEKVEPIKGTFNGSGYGGAKLKDFDTPNPKAASDIKIQETITDLYATGLLRESKDAAINLITIIREGVIRNVSINLEGE